MTDNINALDIIIIVSAVVFLVCWIAWIIRLIIVGSKLKKRNAMLYKRYEELRMERKKADMYESLLDSYHLNAEDVAGIHDHRRVFRNLENQIKQTKIYKNAKVSAADLAELVGLDKSSFDIMFKEASPTDTLNDFMDSIRLNEAIEMFKNDLNDGELDAWIAQIATDCGFANRRALNNACKRIIGIGIIELLHQLKKIR
ncbi:MAG: hypothetical protein MJY88_02230 [Bacteroidales bacterium]|nr:hypothetical protein [Bacteroidales bacterium]